MKVEFNYLLVLGNSGTGKTTFAKHVVSELKSQGYKCFAFDPNRSWADLMDEEVGPEELGKALTSIAKPLLFERRMGVLVVEDLGFSLLQIGEVFRISISKARNLLRLTLENARKYGLKVIVIAHRLSSDEIDSVTFQMFDAYALFQMPITPYWAKVLGKIAPLKEICSLPRFHYLLWNGGSLTRGVVEPLESHMALEADRDFQMRRLLSQCQSISQKILVLKSHLNMPNARIAEVLGVSENYIRVSLSRWRGRGVSLPDGRRINTANLIF